MFWSNTIRGSLFVLFVSTGTAVNAQATTPVAASARADSLFSAGDFTAAAREYEELSTQTPMQPRTLMRLGTAAYNLKDYARAAAAFERAAQLGGSGAAFYNAGAMHARLGHKDEAFRWLTRADSTGFAILNLLSSDDDLASLRGDSRLSTLREKAQRTLTPCASDTVYQRLAFWVGEWDVKSAAQQRAGASSVKSVSGGCAIYENWTDPLGTEGKSLTTWNPATGQYQQFWVAQRANVTEYRRGEWKNGGLVLIAEGPPRNNSKTLIRMTLSPNGSGVVRQMFENSSDDGATWSLTGDLYYHRRAQ
jgi:tetratricopeptide (TPR) repeat protein